MQLVAPLGLVHRKILLYCAYYGNNYQYCSHHEQHKKIEQMWKINQLFFLQTQFLTYLEEKQCVEGYLL